MSARALLNKKPNPTREEIIQALEGNLCRCTGYRDIIESVEAAVSQYQKEGAA
jgi:carbon-monoxide dehydrogenase small subunit